MTETAGQADIRERLLDAALINVAFDGWSETTFRAACQDAGIERAVANVVCPRGAVDLALAYHERGDVRMLSRLAEADLPTMRLRDRIAAAVRLRIEAIDDKEAVRRGTALFSLPHYAGDGARALWGTSDAIWNALGDSATDVNWYTKRASLSAVYGATILFWLGDESDGYQDTWEFLDRRVDNVLMLEQLRARTTANPVSRAVFAGPNWLASRIRRPGGPTAGAPGIWSGDTDTHSPSSADEPG